MQDGQFHIDDPPIKKKQVQQDPFASAFNAVKVANGTKVKLSQIEKTTDPFADAFNAVKKKETSGLGLPTGSEPISPSTSDDGPSPIIKKEGPLNINQDRLGKSFLDRDIDAKYDFSLSNPALFKSQNKFSLRDIYNQESQARFDAERDFHKADVKSSQEKLASYMGKRVSELNKTIDEAKDNLPGVQQLRGYGAQKYSELDNELRDIIAGAEIHKEKLKASVFPVAANMVIDNALKNPDQFRPEEIGRHILAISDPDYSFLIKKGESKGGAPIADAGIYGDPKALKQAEDTDGLVVSRRFPVLDPMPPSMAADKNPIYRSYIERLGLDIAKNVLENKPDSEEKTKLLNAINSFESDFDLRNEELTAQRVREKLGVFFYKKANLKEFKLNIQIHKILL